MDQYKIGVIGNGSWATALVKMLTDNGHAVNWWMRNGKAIEHIKKRGHNPAYLSSVQFDTALLQLSDNIEEVVSASGLLVLGVPSAYIQSVLEPLNPDALKDRKILSAIKGLISKEGRLLNDFLLQQYGVPVTSYFTVMGPCHAEEVAAQKLSYLTFSGSNEAEAEGIAALFKTEYINTIVNTDISGVQYAAVLKNIYALGAGIAHGLDYGDNFLSVYIANGADEMAGFLRKAGIQHMVVGEHESGVKKDMNYAASAYLGDLLVTCYSLYSRNRTFGTMVGKGYTVQAARLELNMVAEGYYAARSIYHISQKLGAEIPIAETIYRILWEKLQPRHGFAAIEEVLI